MKIEQLLEQTKINIINEDEIECFGDAFYEEFGWIEDVLTEAEYRGRKVTLNKPFRTPGGPRKFSVYVKNKKGNVIKVSFGQPGMRIKKSSKGAKKSFAARHKCHTAKDRTTARYWSCRAPLTKGSGYW
jgi:hypothetical protein